MHGWLILDKPAGMTSTKAGSLVKRAFKVKSLGHAGTLDPFATGVLPLALGEATKIMPYVVEDIKEYEFEMTFGEQRDSDDIEGQIVATTTVIPTQVQILDVLDNFRGTITQVPPIYSALKIEGKRACDLARQGKDVTMKSRQVEIHKLELLGIRNDNTSEKPNIARLRVLCGKGTYVRALGRDIAHSLGSLAYLNQLRRTRVGKFSLKNAVTLDIVLEGASFLDKNVSETQEGKHPLLLSIRDVLDDIPALPVSDSEAIKIRQGQSIPYESGELNQMVLILHGDKELALAQYNEGRLYPKRLFLI